MLIFEFLKCAQEKFVHIFKNTNIWPGKAKLFGPTYMYNTFQIKITEGGLIVKKRVQVVGQWSKMKHYIETHDQ